MCRTSVFILILSTISLVNSAKILGVFTTPSYSHQIVYQPIWRELSLRGHEVTVLTPNPLNDPTLTNLTEIDLSYSYQIWEKNSVALNGVKELSTTVELKELINLYMKVTDYQLTHPLVKELLRKNETKYDLIIVEFVWPVIYGFKDIFNCPMIGITSAGLVGNGYEIIGNPQHPILDPDVILAFSSNLSFKERVISTIYQILSRLVSKYAFEPMLDQAAQKYFGNIRPVIDIGKEVSLVLANKNLAIRNPLPSVPALIEIPSMHIRPPKKLPTDLQNYLDNATEGVIYFSLGTNIKSDRLPKEKLNQLLETLRQLPYKVLWKFENDNLSNKPDNVEIRKWLPQQDVLRHKNIKVFVTQGGLQSLDEAVHFQVPVLAIPFFADQHYNAHLVEQKGFGLSLDFHYFTVDEFKYKVNELATNRKYRKTIKKLSKIAKDQPQSGLEKSIWWIEYVLRHKGAKHLKYAAVDLPFYQYYLIDVGVFLLLTISVVCFIITNMFKQMLLFSNSIKRGIKSNSKSHSE